MDIKWEDVAKLKAFNDIKKLEFKASFKGEPLTPTEEKLLKKFGIENSGSGLVAFNEMGRKVLSKADMELKDKVIINLLENGKAGFFG